ARQGARADLDRALPDNPGRPRPSPPPPTATADLIGSDRIAGRWTRDRPTRDPTGPSQAAREAPAGSWPLERCARMICSIAQEPIPEPEHDELRRQTAQKKALRCASGGRSPANVASIAVGRAPDRGIRGKPSQGAGPRTRICLGSPTDRSPASG